MDVFHVQRHPLSHGFDLLYSSSLDLDTPPNRSTMSGHVVYSCACLNVRLHLANNYYSDRHNAHRAAAFIRLSDPHLEGWQFELGMGGVQSVRY